MGQTARLQLIRDRFITRHSSCELRRYLDSVPPETPIRDVVDRCRVWESHADPEIRQVSKPSPDPIYPAYVVGDSEHVGETLRVAAVTKPKSPQDQLEDLLRWLLANMVAPVPVPAPLPEVPTVDKLLQRLVAETQGRQPAAVSPPEPVGLGNLVRSYLSGQQTSGLGRDQSEEIGMASYVFHAESRVMLRLVVPLWMNRFRLCYQDREWNRHQVVSL